MPAATETRFVDVDGRRIEALRSGEGSRDVVFLHEGLGSAALWRDVPARIATEAGVTSWAYSRAGYGGSDPVELPRPLDYMEREGETGLPAVLDALGIAQAVLVGHSDGASIAIVGAASPWGRDRVRGLVLVAPHVFTEEVGLRSIEAAREAYEHGDLRARLARWHGDNVDVAFRGWNDAWLDPRFPTAFDLRRWLSEVRVPTLLVQGDADAYGTLAQLDAIESGVAGRVERLVLPGCGHAPHRERPAALVQRVMAFLRDLPK